jgi:hypothetical protein
MSMVERCAECGSLDAYGLCANHHRAQEEQDMATAAENDDLIIPAEPVQDIAALIRDGWRPPARLVEHYRPLMLAYYRARGFKFAGTTALTDTDIETIVGIMGVLDYLGAAHPAPATTQPTE